jgi:tRNA(Ile)-lysidine synthase TilS/MesJ
MQDIIGYMRRAIEEYKMIRDGDTIAVAVSGGKDSVMLLSGLIRLRTFIGIDYSLTAITVDPCFGGKQTDYAAIESLCARNEIPYHIRRTDLGEIIFETRAEHNPCSLCARMRRGIIHDMTKEYGCNKVALGHNYDDAVETFVMNLFQEGRIGCFQPVTYLSRKDITMIRPLAFAPEKNIRNAVVKASLPTVKSGCPVDGHTGREDTKKWLQSMEKNGFPGLAKKIFGAMRRAHISGW